MVGGIVAPAGFEARRGKAMNCLSSDSVSDRERARKTLPRDRYTICDDRNLSSQSDFIIVSERSVTSN